MRAAWQEVVDDTLSHTRPTFSSFMAALNKRTVHRDVPVLLKYKNGDTCVCYASETRMASDTVSVNVLIPEETAREIAWWAITRLVEMGGCIDEAMAEIDRAIADYRVNGPGASHE